MVQCVHACHHVAQEDWEAEQLQTCMQHQVACARQHGMCAGGSPKLADMGLARRWEAETAACLTGETGTYQYMAPEMIRHEMYDTRADVYSFGVVLAEILSQKLPYADLYCTPVQVRSVAGAGVLASKVSSALLALFVHMGLCTRACPARSL